jgi:hypothetical protein
VTRAGEAVDGARVALQGPAGLATVFTTDADGRFAGAVAQTTYNLSADDGQETGPAVTVVLDSDDDDPEVALEIPAEARVTVHITDLAGAAIPGKITVLCSGDCPSPRQSSTPARFYRDVRFDGLPAGTQEIRYLDPTGTAELRLPPGAYTLAASRGPEWSLARKDVTLAAGAPGSNDAVTLAVAHVLETPGWISGDFHVHAINSPDSPVPNRTRVLNFLAEGVDLIVSTDHDYITDFTPEIAALNAQALIATLPGVETTPMDFGHFNAYPLSFDKNDLTGGAPDWGGGRGPTLTPHGLREAQAAHAAAGAPLVTQVNHARGGQGFFSAAGLDTATLTTRTDPKLFRQDLAPVSESDTGLFDRGFTAMEIMNGWLDERFYPLLNDWFAFLNRGVLWTGTAVSDTHGVHGRGGYPRTWVRLGTADAPALISAATLGAAMNDHRAEGSTAPFVTVTAAAGASSAEIGGTIATSGAGAPVTLTVRVQAAEWAPFNKVELFVNTPGTTSAPYEQKNDAPSPQVVQEFTLGDTDRVEVSAGHRRWDKTVAFALAPQQDAWAVVVVRGNVDLYPVVGKGGAHALAFTNPIFIDVSGDGWSPPVKLAAHGKPSPAAARPAPGPAEQRRLDAPRRWIGAEEWDAFLRWLAHD